jgi:hypothetical protein
MPSGDAAGQQRNHAIVGGAGKDIGTRDIVRFIRPLVGGEAFQRAFAPSRRCAVWKPCVDLVVHPEARFAIVLAQSARTTR